MRMRKAAASGTDACVCYSRKSTAALSASVGAALYFASAASSFTTGAILRVDGGT